MSQAVEVTKPDVLFHNYTVFLRELARQLHEPRGAADFTGLLVVHLTNSNRINSVAGYRAGQQVSVEFAEQVYKMLRAGDWMKPLAKDRFAIVLDHIKNEGHLLLAANRIARFASALPIPDAENLQLDVRIGAAIFPEHGNCAESLLRNSELAIESAERRGSTFALYKEEESQKVTSDWDIEAQISNALENNEFELFFQPKVDAHTLLPAGAEGLTRWRSPVLGDVNTERFIQIVEGTDHIDALTDRALHSAARAMSEWPDNASDLTVAVNLAPKVIEHGNIVSSFKHVAAIWGVSLDRFTAEVTENGIISTAGAAIGVLQQLRDIGVRVSIDDFGTGNSSLAYFKHIPADELKIDKSFVFGMLDDEANLRLVKTIIDLAHSFDLTVVAEGVEDAERVKLLQELGCDVLQGYYFSKAMPHAAFVDYLTEQLDRNNSIRFA